MNYLEKAEALCIYHKIDIKLNNILEVWQEKLPNEW